jgi:hypothetical protein
MTLFADTSRTAASIRPSIGQLQDDSPGDDVEFPAGSVINLAGKLRPDQTIIRFTLSGGQVLLTRPGTKLTLLDRSHAVPIFVEVDAANVDEGDRVCVVGDAFLEMARPLVNITARAAEEIRDYHQLVTERFARLPGSSEHERLNHLVGKMGRPEVTVQRAKYWVDLQAQLSAAIEDVVPHAPRDWGTFLAFMTALNVSQSIASRFWTWAVIAQRVSRLKAAISFHDAYRAILTDNYAAQSRNPERARDIARLKRAAEDFVAVVEQKSEQRGESDRA